MQTGIKLPPWIDPPCWEVSPPDFTRFMGELSSFAPVGSVLCLEGGGAVDVERYLEARPGPIENETSQGFLKMRSKVFYMPITPENLRGLRSLTERHAEPEICSSLCVYEVKR